MEIISWSLDVAGSGRTIRILTGTSISSKRFRNFRNWARIDHYVSDPSRPSVLAQAWCHSIGQFDLIFRNNLIIFGNDNFLFQKLRACLVFHLNLIF